MKLTQLLHVLLLFVAGQLLFSCGSARYYDFGSNHSGTAYHKNRKAVDKTEAGDARNAPAAAENTLQSATAPAEAPVLEASAADAAPAPPQRRIYDAELTSTAPAAAPVIAPEQVNKAEAAKKLGVKAEKAKQKKGLFAGIKAIKASFLEVLFAILIPPVGVAIHEGITTRFWISLVLTLLFWLPGAIYALLVVTETI